jgi:hypothetical protein
MSGKCSSSPDIQEFYISCPEILVRIHQTLKVTPAMASGVSYMLREMSDMVKVLEGWDASQSL